MNAIVVYKTKYGSTKTYAEWIAEELSADIRDAKTVKADDLLKYDTIIYGGGLYAEVINGVSLITQNYEKLKDKKLIVYTTGITPPDVKEYYEGEVMEKNFKNGAGNIKIFNFMGKMILEELTPVHRAAIKSLKKIMEGKKNPSEMVKLLIKLCDTFGDFTDKEAIGDLVEYAKAE